jgi:TonB-dependent SusC/RagA subfamily outer membrane receptor
MKKIVPALFCALYFCVPAFSQDAKTPLSLDGIVSRLQTLSTTKATEKVYLHFDRTTYNAGDTTFFKAYLTLGEQHQPSKLSGVLHADLVNPNDSLVKYITLQVNNGLAWGDFALPNSLPRGLYHIKAYTQWMLNSADPNVFDQPIIINSPVSQTRTLSAQQTKIANKYDIQFFPEGGTFVNDIPAKLAFKAIDHNGIGANIKGVIVDNLNTEVTKFETRHLGMGIINITPVEGRTYKAKLTYADGTSAAVDLPKADEKGMTLLVNNTNPDKLLIEINANRAYYQANKNKEIGITIYSGGGAVRSVKTALDGQVLDLNLGKKDFQTGIVRVTLFSQAGEPMNERLSFIQNDDLINLQTTVNKPSYTTREKVHLTLNAKKDDKPVVGYFSASVVDAAKIPVEETAETTILTHLLLTSDLKGFVEQPNYYFNHVTNDTRADLDMLMLTQGYRRFEWKQILGNDNATALTYPVEKGLDISGTVKTNSGAPVANGNITLLTQNGGSMLTQVTDANGRFTFPSLAYTDNTAFVIQAKTSEGKSNTQIIMDQPKEPALVADNKRLAGSVDSGEGDRKPAPAAVYLADASGKLLKEVVVKDKFLDSHTNTITEFNDQSGLGRSLEGRLPGVSLINGVPYLRERVGISEAGPMMVIIDGMQGGSVPDLNVSDVESVKMLKNVDAAIYGLQGSNGVLLITTKKNKGLPVNKKLSPGIITYAPKGFYKARTFYSPVYGASVRPGKKTDDRVTIYWNPDVVTDKDGMASLDFYNADGKGNYRVIVEGIDDNGNVGRSVYTYKVE